MKGRLGDKQRLEHILEAIKEINSYTSPSNFDIFCENSMMRFATIKQLEIIGEAANTISDATRRFNSDIEWMQIIGLRHILVHEYFGVDNKVIWQIISEDMPILKTRIEALLAMQSPKT